MQKFSIWSHREIEGKRKSTCPSNQNSGSLDISSQFLSNGVHKIPKENDKNHPTKGKKGAKTTEETGKKW